MLPCLLTRICALMFVGVRVLGLQCFLWWICVSLLNYSPQITLKSCVQEESVNAFFSLPFLQEVIEKPKTSGRIKTTLDPNFYFRDPARRGRGRTGPRGGGPPREDRNSGGGNRRSFDENRKEGGRGGGRRDFDGGRKEFDGGRKEFEGGRRAFGGGGFGGGRGRGNNRKDRAPNVEDESDFPSLGSGAF